MENLKIIHAGLKGLKAHTFMHVRGLKRLDLSENRIDSIENDAFQDASFKFIIFNKNPNCTLEFRLAILCFPLKYLMDSPAK